MAHIYERNENSLNTMSNFKCRMTKEIQMSNDQLCYWDFGLELTLVI